MENTINSWLSESIKKVYQSNNSCEIHIDEIIKKSLKTKEELLITSCEIFDIVCNYFSKNNNKDLRLNLFVDLESYDSDFKAGCKDLVSLISCIEIKAMPVIVLFKEPTGSMMEGEYYKSDLLFKIYDWNNIIRCIYEEYRYLEELKYDEPYSRVLCCEYKG